MNRYDALREINETQDFYVSKLIDIITGIDKTFESLKEIDFTSPTGTGKTVMVAKLINNLPEYFFVITSLSKGQLKTQVKNKIDSLAIHNNYVVFGLSDFTLQSKLTKNDLAEMLQDKKVIWIRDEGHIATNRWFEVLGKMSSLIINFSATNKHNNGIQCNFMHTMMLRTVAQNIGSPSQALDKLLEVKKTHEGVSGYNPCALFRIINDDNLNLVIEECEKRHLKYINITDENFDITALCDDSNEYDVIINKLKITEGIDLRRCHVIYIDNRPQKESTIIQIIGRARRNALFWRNDIDILANENKRLLEETSKCYVFFNVEKTEIQTTEDGEFLYSLCDTVSVEALKPDITVEVNKGRMQNGLKIIELENSSGSFHITQDNELGVNIVDNESFYEIKEIESNNFVIDLSNENINLKKIYFKENVREAFKIHDRLSQHKYDRKKQIFYKIKLYCERVKNIVDVPYWEEFLEMGNKRRLVNSSKWGDFLYGKDAPYLFDIIRSSGKGWITEADGKGFYDYAAIDRTPIYKDAINIFEKDYFGRFYINRELVKFVDKIEIQSFEKCVELFDAIEQNKKVKVIDTNKFKYAPHYFTDYFKNHGITNLSELKNKIFSTKAFAIYGASTNYWKKMLENITEFIEIDNYDVRVLNLNELNQLLDLGASKNLVDTIILGKFPTKTLTSFYNRDVFGINKNNPSIIVKPRANLKIYKESFNNSYLSYKKIVNDYEIAAIGPDTMRLTKAGYVEETPVTSKLSCYSKLKRFIDYKYKNILAEYRSHFFNGGNNLGLDKKCNSCLGFCVEYFAKLKIFGDEAFTYYINQALKEAKTSEVNDVIRVRAAMLSYVTEMQICYGTRVSSVIPTIRIERLVKKEYELFVQLVVSLGNKAADFIKEKLYFDCIDSKPLCNVDPVLSVNHISALCDFITKDTILDLKCTSTINERYLEQVLAYHYLSKKRSDLDIKRVIVYDVVTGKFIEVKL